MNQENTARQLQSEHEKAIEFLRFVFEATDPEHEGNLYLAAMNGSGQMHRVRSGRIQEIADLIQGGIMDGENGRNAYYITANTFSGLDRDDEHLFSLKNIVVDIDSHSHPRGHHMTEIARQGIVYFILEDMRDYLPYTPAAVVFTGRGVQLWYPLEQVAAHKNRSAYNQAANWITDRVSEFVADHSNVFGNATVDRAASGKPTRLYRVPESFNMAAGARGSVEILHQERFDLYEIQEEARKAKDAKCTAKDVSKRELQNVIKMRPANAGACASHAEYRVEALEKLAKLRAASGSWSGYRDEVIFEACCGFSFLDDPEYVEERIGALNDSFEDPLPERQIRAVIRCNQRKLYRMKNTTMIERLEISEEEQQAIGLYPTGSGKGKARERARAEKREQKKERDELILELWQAGERQADIADAAGCSPRTVRNVIKRAGMTAWSNSTEETEATATKAAREAVVEAEAGDSTPKNEDKPGKIVEIGAYRKQKTEDQDRQDKVGKKRPLYIFGPIVAHAQSKNILDLLEKLGGDGPPDRPDHTPRTSTEPRAHQNRPDQTACASKSDARHGRSSPYCDT